MKKSNLSFVNLALVILILFNASCTQKLSKKEDQSRASYSMDDFKGVLKIDMHAHISSEGKTMIEEARANNFRLLIMTVDAEGNPPMVEQVRVCRKHFVEDGDIIAFATAFTLQNWDSPDWSEKVIAKLKQDFDNGAHGVKVWKNIGMVEKDKSGQLIMLDDPKFDPVFQFIKNENKVLLSHAGEPQNCWMPLEKMTVNNDKSYFSEHPEYHMYLHPEMPSYEDQIRARDNMLKKNLEINFVSVHLASLEWSVDEIADFLDQFPKATVDLAARMGQLQYQSQRDRKKVIDFIVKYQDRILYGTDFGQSEETNTVGLKKRMQKRWMNDWKYFNTDEKMSVPELDTPIKGLKLTKKVVDKIYRLNAEKVFPHAW